MAERRTGSWVVKRTIGGAAPPAYLIGGSFDPNSIRSWLAWGDKPDAYIFPTKKAAREALVGHGMRGITIERSYGHEASA